MNAGDEYEISSYDKCYQKGLIFPGTERGGSSSKADLKISHNSKPLNVEVKKLKKVPDMVQRYLGFDLIDGWFWKKPDELTQYYDSQRYLQKLKSDLNPNYIPRRLTMDPNHYTDEDKRYDLDYFRKNMGGKMIEIFYELDLEALFTAYKLKNTYYIQCEDFGFYHLYSDKFNLGTQQYDGKIKLRMRMKIMRSNPPHKVAHQAVIKPESKKNGGWPTPSNYDIDEKEGRSFPNFRLKV
jgi:hypothetical protein